MVPEPWERARVALLVAVAVSSAPPLMAAPAIRRVARVKAQGRQRGGWRAAFGPACKGAGGAAFGPARSIGFAGRGFAPGTTGGRFTGWFGTAISRFLQTGQ